MYGGLARKVWSISLRLKLMCFLYWIWLIIYYYFFHTRISNWGIITSEGPQIHTISVTNMFLWRLDFVIFHCKLSYIIIYVWLENLFSLLSDTSGESSLAVGERMHEMVKVSSSYSGCNSDYYFIILLVLVLLGAEVVVLRVLHV